jgi:hypothetical protein
MKGMECVQQERTAKERQGWEGEGKVRVSGSDQVRESLPAECHETEVQQVLQVGAV